MALNIPPPPLQNPPPRDPPPAVNRLFTEANNPTGNPPGLLDTVLNEVFAPNYLQGFLRLFLLVLAPFFIILFFNWINRPIITRETWPWLLLFIPAFLLAFEIAALYIKSLFCLDNIGVARRALLARAFGLSAEVVRIENGKVPEDPNNVILETGGPGLVQVNFDSTALFEKANGEPYVISSTTEDLFNIPDMKFVPIQGFDRLRTAVNLRDHIMEWELKGRTLNGIVIKATNLQVVFSLRRNPIQLGPQTPGIPVLAGGTTYPFYKWGIYRLFYQQQMYNSEYEGVIKNMIQMEFRNLIQNSTLEQLLVSIQNSDNRGINQNFLQRYLNLNAIPQSINRPTISNLFTDFVRKFNRDAYGAGIELEWINIGVWNINEDSIMQQYINAWTMELESNNLTAAPPLARLQTDVSSQQMRVLLQEVIRQFVQSQADGKTREETINSVLTNYHGKLKRASAWYQDNQLQVPPELIQAITILQQNEVGRNRRAGIPFVGPDEEPNE